ncbi:MAG TPA: hypothetical protein VNS58_00200 [Puia sp.]|nr:hypothetical protein [Puia sp.]
MSDNLHTISSETAIDLIIAGKPLINYRIRDTLDLYKQPARFTSGSLIPPFTTL